MTSIENLVDELARLDVRLWVEGDTLRCSAPDEVLTLELRSRLAEHKAELIAFLQKANRPLGGTSGLARADRDGPIPLAPGQERLWALSEIRPGSSVYHISTAFFLSGPLDVRVLERSLTELQERHEILRTAFPADHQSPRQAISGPAPVVLPVMDVENDLRRLSAVRREQEVIRLLQSEVRRPFDLQRGPLWRCLLLRLENDIHVLSFCMHHIIFDGMSKVVFLEELGEIYRAFLAGEAPRLEPLSSQYADFAHWQHERLSGSIMERQLDYWRKRLDGEVSALRVPNDRPRSGAVSGGISRSFSLPRQTAGALAELSRRENCSLYVTLLSAFNALLHRYTGQEDLLVCSPLAARDRVELERLIGYFNNIVIMRSDLSGDPTFPELMERVRRVVLEAFENQSVPLQRLAELPGLTRISLNRAMFSYQDTSSRTFDLPEISASPIDVRKDEADFELAMYMERDSKGRLAGVLEYDAGLFEDETITELLDNFTKVLERLTSDPHQRLSQLPGTYEGPAQVEALLAGHPQIDQAVIVPARAPGPVAYLVLNEYDVPDLDEVRGFLASRLPDYLAPAAYVPIDTIPLLGDGSVDREALPLPSLVRGRDRRYVAPRTDLERKLAEIWQKVLWLDHEVGVEEDFRDLGGHSLLSVELVSEIEKQLNRELPPAVLHNLSTVSEMARMLEEGDGSPVSGRSSIGPVEGRGPMRTGLPPEIYQGLLKYTASWAGFRPRPDSLIVGLNTTGTRRPLFWCLQRYGELTQLAKYLGPDQPIFGMRSGHRVMIRSQENIEALAAYYASEILDHHSVGPYFVGGNCQAAKIAFQIARQLQDLGYEVALLILMEKFVPFQFRGRIALVFGVESDRNPYLHFREPERGWRKYYAGETTVDFITGKHTQFFKEPNIQGLAEVVRRRLDEAQAVIETGPPLAQSDAFQRLPTSAYRAELRPRGPATAAPGNTFTISVNVTNISSVAWRSGRESGIALANRWLNANGNVVASVDGRALLDDDLEPSSQMTMELEVTAPERAGSYFLDLDLVDEGITWFSAQGSDLCRLPIEVR